MTIRNIILLISSVFIGCILYALYELYPTISALDLGLESGYRFGQIMFYLCPSLLFLYLISFILRIVKRNRTSKVN
jgi:hypothetical protein